LLNVITLRYDLKN